MNINFGLFPPIDQPVRRAEGRRLRGTAKTLERKRELSQIFSAHWPDAAVQPLVEIPK